MNDREKRQLASEIASADYQVKKFTKIRDDLKIKAIESGCVGITITTLDNKGVVSFTDGKEYTLDEKKAIDVIGAERYADLLLMKRERVSLALSDVLPFAKKEEVSKVVDGSVKMYVKKA